MCHVDPSPRQKTSSQHSENSPRFHLIIVRQVLHVVMNKVCHGNQLGRHCLIWQGMLGHCQHISSPQIVAFERNPRPRGRGNAGLETR